VEVGISTMGSSSLYALKSEERWWAAGLAVWISGASRGEAQVAWLE
jgi:hypothetical protein